MNNFEVNLSDLQPSQLYICLDKLAVVERETITNCESSFSPLPVKMIASRITLTDGHTRALAARRRGCKSVQVYWDRDELDWESYEICVQWCIDANIHSVLDLESRIVTVAQYAELWIERCSAMHARLASLRKTGEGATEI